MFLLLLLFTVVFSIQFVCNGQYKHNDQPLLQNSISTDYMRISDCLILHRGRGRGGHDRMVVGFTTTYAISAYHN